MEGENAIHPGRFESVAKEIKNAGDIILDITAKEDKLLASLHNTDPWNVLKTRIENKIKALNEVTRVTAETAGLVQSMELHGFKNFAKDLVIEELQSIIGLVELNAKFQKDQKKEKEDDEE